MNGAECWAEGLAPARFGLLASMTLPKAAYD